MTTVHQFALFDTAIGRCGIVWSERGIAGVQFPEADEHKTRERLLRRFPGAAEAKPVAQAQRAIDGIVALLNGEPRDLRDITIDDHEIACVQRPRLCHRARDPARRRRTLPGLDIH